MNGKKHSEDEILELKDSAKWSRHKYAFMWKLSTPFEVARIEMQNGGIWTKWRVVAVVFTMDILSFFLVPEKFFRMVLKH
jgi:hypothetical protein